MYTRVHENFILVRLFAGGESLLKSSACIKSCQRVNEFDSSSAIKYKVTIEKNDLKPFALPDGTTIQGFKINTQM
jgi:hypothetical protein